MLEYCPRVDSSLVKPREFITSFQDLQLCEVLLVDIVRDLQVESAVAQGVQRHTATHTTIMERLP